MRKNLNAVLIHLRSGPLRNVGEGLLDVLPFIAIHNTVRRPRKVYHPQVRSSDNFDADYKVSAASSYAHLRRIQKASGYSMLLIAKLDIAPSPMCRTNSWHHKQITTFSQFAPTEASSLLPGLFRVEYGYASYYCIACKDFGMQSLCRVVKREEISRWILVLHCSVASDALASFHVPFNRGQHNGQWKCRWDPTL